MRRAHPLRGPVAVGRGAGAAGAVRRDRAAARDRPRGQRLLRRRRAGRAGADDSRGRAVGHPHPARRGQDPDAGGRRGGRARPARHDDGAVPVRGPVRAAAGRAARRRLPARHPGRRRLPGDLAGRADRATARSARWRRPSRRTGSGSTRCSWSGPRWPPAAPARTCTTPGTSTASAAREPAGPPGLREATVSGRQPPPARPPSQPGPSRQPDTGASRSCGSRTCRAPRRSGRGRCAPGGRPAPARPRRPRPRRPRCVTRPPQQVVEVALPERPPGQLRRSSPACVDPVRATAVVVKDAGDDPDVTHGAHLTATGSAGGPSRASAGRRRRASAS